MSTRAPAASQNVNNDTWVLIADGSRGRLYSVLQKGAPWTLIKEYTHPASRVSEGGLTDSPPGRTHGSVAGGARSSMESKTSPKEVQLEHFAHELSGALTEGHGKQAYNRIVLVAPPHFLGLLRKTITDTVSKLIVGALNKDYMHLSEKDMRVHVEPLLA